MISTQHSSLWMTETAPIRSLQAKNSIRVRSGAPRRGLFLGGLLVVHPYRCLLSVSSSLYCGDPVTHPPHPVIRFLLFLVRRCCPTPLSGAPVWPRFVLARRKYPSRAAVDFSFARGVGDEIRRAEGLFDSPPTASCHARLNRSSRTCQGASK
jgi:hypothetical protein